MLFGNGLSALLTLLGISSALVLLFVIGPLVLAGPAAAHPRGWFAWAVALAVIAAVGFLVIVVLTPLVTWAIPLARPARITIAVATLVPVGLLLGIPMPTGIRLLSARSPQMVAWAWGMNGALSVLGATLAIFIAMNWGFQITLLAASATYLIGLAAFLLAV
jgi:hypothetical protein